MRNHIRVLTAIALSGLIIEISGLFLEVPVRKILILVLFSSFAEFMTHFLAFMHGKEAIDNRETYKLFFNYVKKLILFMLPLACYAVYLVLTSSSVAFSALFYIQVFTVCFTVCYILSSNNIRPKERKQKKVLG